VSGHPDEDAPVTTWAPLPAVLEDVEVALELLNPEDPRARHQVRLWWTFMDQSTGSLRWESWFPDALTAIAAWLEEAPAPEAG
jgi:hypothetical protein